GILRAPVLGDVLSGRDADRARRAGDLGSAARAWRQVPAGVGGAGLDRARDRGDQAAPLRPAALSGHRDPARRDHGSAHAVAQTLVGEWYHLVVPGSGRLRRRGPVRAVLYRPPVRAPGLAGDWRIRGDGPAGLEVVRSRRTRPFIVARRCR